MHDAAPDVAAPWGLKWVEIPEEHACTTDLHSYMATFVCEQYVIRDVIAEVNRNAGQHMDKSTAEGVWGGADPGHLPALLQI
eukprot:3814381-Prymnesium_polylepis.1